MPLLWLIVVLLPLALVPLLIRAPKARAGHAPWQSARLWLTLAPWPALMAGTLWPDSVMLSSLWPGAEWGLTGEFNRAVLLFTATLWSMAGLYAGQFDAVQRRQRTGRLGTFSSFWLLALAGNLLLIIAADAISFYIGFTVMSLSAYGLVIHPRTPSARRAGRLYLQLAVLGEMLLYGGLMLRLYEAGGSSAFAEWHDIATQPLTAALLLIGFGLKAGVWPLHLWLPQAHPVAPAAASAILSGAMLKAGILGLWQFMPIHSEVLTAWSPWLLSAGFIGAFYAALVGLLSVNAKTALAFSSVSQMGYLLAILALAWRFPDERAAWSVVLGLYAVHHGLAKGSLFLAAGLSAAGKLPLWLWWCLGLPALALAGLPLTSGAAAKMELKTALTNTDWETGVVLLGVGSASTALIALRALNLMRPRSPTAPRREATQKEPSQPLVLSHSLLLPVLLLPVLSLALASVVLPWVWSPLREAQWSSLSVENLVALAWPLGTALVLAWGWRRAIKRVPKPLQTLPSPGPVLSLYLHRFLRGGLRPALNQRKGLFNWLKTLVHGLTALTHGLKAPHAFPTAVRATRWRAWERRWNRLWQREPIIFTAWLSGLLLLMGWLWL